MKKIISVLLLLTLSISAYSQTGGQREHKSKLVEIYFDQGASTVDRALRENEKNIRDLIYSLDLIKQDTASITQKVEVNSYTSPEGGKSLNNKLSESRSEATRNFLKSECDLSDDLIVVRSHGIWWEELRELVDKSDMQYKAEILDILDNSEEETWKKMSPSDSWPTMVDSRNKQLMELKGGIPYKYMSDNFFPLLRRSTIRAAYYTNEAEPQEVIVIPEPKPEPTPEPTPEPEPEPESEPEPTPEPIVESIVEPTTTPLFAIKTNLLFDVATLVNIEAEVPIGDRWSVAGEWIFPWWSSCGNSSNEWQSGGKSSRRNTLQLLNGNIEAKYWLGDRTTKAIMTGWHVGLYAGGGLYDLEYEAEGYQGEFFIAAGVSGGYAHTINKSGNLRMEYSVGVGYLQTEYRYYQEHWGIDDTWHTIRQESGKYSWFGPTRARVSLVWMLNRTK